MDRTISLALKGAAGVLAASMSMMGLAYAGVNLPGQAAAQALEAVTGVELPNQDGEENGKSVAEDVKAVVESDMEKGCEFGQAVASAASQNARGERSDEDRCTETDGEDTAPRGSKATGDEKSAQGRATAGERSQGASDAAADNAARGSDRASAGAGNAPTGESEDDGEDDGGMSGRETAGERSSGASTGGASNAEGRP